jgi:hypothetical protein
MAAVVADPAATAMTGISVGGEKRHGSQRGRANKQSSNHVSLPRTPKHT